MLNVGSRIAVAVMLCAAMQFATPAKAETWSFFPWAAPAQPEKPRVTARLEQPAAERVTPVQTYSAPAPVRTTRVVAVERPLPRPQPVISSNVFSRPYMIVGLGL